MNEAINDSSKIIAQTLLLIHDFQYIDDKRELKALIRSIKDNLENALLKLTEKM